MYEEQELRESARFGLPSVPDGDESVRMRLGFAMIIVLGAVLALSGLLDDTSPRVCLSPGSGFGLGRLENETGPLGSLLSSPPAVGRSSLSGIDSGLLDLVGLGSGPVSEFVVVDMESWYEPEDPEPGDSILFYVEGLDIPPRPQVLPDLCSLVSEKRGGGASPIAFPMRSFDEPSAGLYQIWGESGNRCLVSGFFPIIIPAADYVKDSPLMSLSVREIGEWWCPPWATIVVHPQGDEGRQLSHLVMISHIFKPDSAGATGGRARSGEWVRQGDDWVFQGKNDPWSSPGPPPPWALVFCWVFGIGPDGVPHFSTPVSYTLSILEGIPATALILSALSIWIRRSRDGTRSPKITEAK